MEGNSSGDEMVAVKTRKPYTITKQREKWTEEEHSRFLEALKLYGRAWQRIEEHIGTKTAVQIRSHAQKFFTKLEKEALQKGITTGQANDIDIPPPRPKRKPSSPYPRKSNSGAFPSRGAKNIKALKSKSPPTNEEIDEDAVQEKFAATQKLKSVDIPEDPNHSEALNISPDDLSVSISSVNKSSSNHDGKNMIFLPTQEKMDELENKASVSHELDQDLDNSDKVSIGQETDVLGNYTKPYVSLSMERREITSKLQVLTTKDTEKGEQSLPHKPVVHMKGRNDADSRQTDDSVDENHALTDQIGGNVNANSSENAVASAIPDQNVPAMGFMHNPMPFFSPFPYSHSIQDIHKSFLNNPSTFSSLISYTLLQNPAVQASARMAASFWSSAEDVTSLHPTPEFLGGENLERNTNPTPTLETIATVTVAAATAWWAAQGLLSWFPPVGYAFSRPNTTAAPSVDEAQPHGHGTGEDLLKEHQKDTNHNLSDDRKLPYQSSKPMHLSLSESNGVGRAENLNELKSTRSNMFESLEASGFHDTDKARRNKKGNRSSCGSNTSYSSDVEADNIEKHGKANTETTDFYFSNSTAFETNHRRSRCNGCTAESWKEVSEEGRITFQELFKRQVLPQSFSPSHAEEAATAMKSGETSKLLVDLNRSLYSATNHNNPHAHAQGQTCIRNNGSQTIGKLKVQYTGFKPYKRCSIEAKENGGATEEEKSGNKRARLQGQDVNGFC